MSLYCLFLFVPPIKIDSLSTLDEMFLAVFVYPKLPCEMSRRSDVVLVWGAVLGMEPACALRSEAVGSAAFAAGTVSLLALPLLIDVLYRLKRLRKRERKHLASHRSAEFVPIYFNKIKLLRND